MLISYQLGFDLYIVPKIGFNKIQWLFVLHGLHKCCQKALKFNESDDINWSDRWMIYNKLVSACAYWTSVTVCERL